MACPLDFGTLNHVAYLLITFIEYILFGNFDGKSNIIFTSVLALKLLVFEPFFFEKELTAQNIVISVSYTITSFIGFNLFSMLVTYMIQTKA